MEPYKAGSRRGSSSEHKEIDKYIKFFSLKAMQCVVQSRTGIKNKTKCNPHAKGLDWFNISLPDGNANSQLQNRIRELFGKRIPGLSQPICVDIILKTSEGSYTVLETWQIKADLSGKEDIGKSQFSIYNGFGVLLRSVITTSRLLPSYHLSRKMGSDYMLFCKVHTSVHELHSFELHNSINIGSLITSSGAVNIKVLYRNKIWLSGPIHAHTYTMNDIESLFLLSLEKDDSKAFFQSVDMFENEIALAASDTNQIQQGFPYASPTLTEAKTMFQNDISQQEKTAMFIGPSVGNINNEVRPIAAFVEPVNSPRDVENFELPSLSSTPPFMSLLNDGGGDQMDKKNTLKNSSSSSHAELHQHDVPQVKQKDSDSILSHRTAEAVGFEDDFVLVELRPAFCSEDGSVGTLYRQCQSPTNLDMFASLEKEDDESKCITLDAQLERYQKELTEFQDFFKILN